MIYPEKESVSEVNVALEGGNDSRATQTRAGPNGLRDMLRWLLALAVALAPLIAVAGLRGPLELTDAIVGVGVLLSLLLVVAVATGALWRARTAANGRHAGPVDSPRAALEVVRSYATRSTSTSGPFDPLTGLPTFQPFSQQLLDEFHRAQGSGEPLAVVLVDVNHLARINRQFGPESGDQVLRHMTACLQLSKRMTDILARMGDDEFGLLLPHSDRAGASAFVERVQEWLAREPITVRTGTRSESIWVGICAGVGVCDETSGDADEVLTAAIDDLNLAREERDRRRLRWKRSA